MLLYLSVFLMQFFSSNCICAETLLQGLSKEFWEIKKHNGTPKITWEIFKIWRSYNPNSNRCLLCLNEKSEIPTYKGDKLLSKRTEVSTNLPNEILKID